MMFIKKLHTLEVNVMKEAKKEKRKYDKRKENDRIQFLKKLAVGGAPLLMSIGLVTIKKLKK